MQVNHQDKEDVEIGMVVNLAVLKCKSKVTDFYKYYIGTKNMWTCSGSHGRRPVIPEISVLFQWFLLVEYRIKRM
jgi:hypothetical protein